MGGVPMKPNVLFIMSDQHHAGVMGCSGNPVVRTPNLDWLATNGVSFTRAYCNNPICSPSRITYATGQYPHTHGFLGNDNYEYPEDNVDTMAAQFRFAGYQTAMVGKSHMVRRWDRATFEHIRYCDLCDCDRGDVLDNHYYRYLVNHGIAHLYDTGSMPPSHPTHTVGYFTSKMPHEHSVEVWTGNESLSFLQARDPARPFFLQVSFERPHPPYAPSEPYDELYDPGEIPVPENAVDAFERRFATKPEALRRKLLKRAADSPRRLQEVYARYYALVTVIDEQIGRLLKYLRDSGELERTVIVYVSDHGDFAGEHGLTRKNIGLYECIHRVPFLLRYPGGPEGEVRDDLVESVDLYPTLTELAGLETPNHVEGRSVISVIEGRRSGKEQVVAEWDWVDQRIFAIRTRRHRLVVYANDGAGELYDYQTDPGELENLFGSPEYRPVRNELYVSLFRHIAGFGTKTSMERDRIVGNRTRHMPARLVLKHCRTWDDLKVGYGYEAP